MKSFISGYFGFSSDIPKNFKEVKCRLHEPFAKGLVSEICALKEFKQKNSLTKKEIYENIEKQNFYDRLCVDEIEKAEGDNLKLVWILDCLEENELPYQEKEKLKILKKIN